MSENAGLQLPFGRLSYDSGNTSFVITLPVLRSIAPIEQSVQRLLTRLKGDQWLRPELEVEGSQVRLRYRWPEELYPVSEVASKWRSSTRRNLPHWFHLAECLLTASSCMMPVGLFPFTPATVFVTASGNKREALGFKFAAIPALSFGLKDWAAADPLTWQWTNPGAFLRPDDFDGKYAAAAALHFCLVGSLVPEHLPNREQFLRFLSGRTGREGLFQKYFGEALPDSMKDEEAATLSQKLVQALRRHPSAAQEGEEGLFAYAQKNITVLRLANRWEYESRPDEALQLWLDHEKWNGPQEVSWWRVARLCERLGRRQEAEQSIFKGLQLEQEDLLEKATELILSRLQKTGRGRSDFSDMRPLIEQCDQIIAAGQMPSEQHDLRAAHLFLKYGGDTEAAVQRLKTPASDAWQKVQQNLLRVKILLAKKQHATKDELSQTSQLCSESLVLLEKGLSSSAQTLSIQAYFYLMDAIAHFFAIAKLNDHSFLKDVFARLVKSVEKSIENDDPAMTNTAVQWLHWVKVFVEYFPDDIKNIVQIGISAFMEVQKSRGISIDNQPDKFPGLPWYPEALIFESVRGD